MRQRIGRYTIEAEVGRGAFGVVYRAFDPNVKRQVAIKVLLAADNPETLSRFRKEAGTTGSLLHPNIISVYEFAEEEGTPYLVMELLDGQTMEEVIKAGQPPEILEKVEIMYQVAEGLQHAHSKGVIHRDMKPANIMVTSRGQAKIMDFGIARWAGHETTWRTRQGNLMGTIPYMAPEQIRGGETDKLVDIFSYGVIYYELLSGVQPFEASDPVTVMYRINSVDPDPLPGRNPEIPEALDSMIRRLMAKEREARVERMEDVLFETQPILLTLRQNRGAALAGEIRPLMAAGDFEAAQPQVKRVLDLDPFHAEAREWREQIKSKLQAASQRVRAKGLIEEGDAFMASRRFADAVALYENALNLHKTAPDLLQRLEEAKAALKNSRDAASLVADAHWELLQQHFEAALAKASEAAKLDPQNPEAASLRDNVAAQIREQRTAATTARIEELASAAEYDAALEALDGIPAEIAGEPVFAALRGRIDEAKAEAARRRRAAEFKTSLARAKDTLASGALPDAEKAAMELYRRFGEEPDAFDFLCEVRQKQAAQRRADAIAAITQSARALIQEKHFDQAIAALNDGLTSYRGDVGMHRLLETAKSLKEAQQRSIEIAAILAEAGQLRDQGAFERAQELVEAAIGKFGPAPELADCKRALEFDREHRDYAIGRDRAVVEGAMFAAGGQTAEAIAFLEDALSRYPGDPEVLRALQDARESGRALEKLKIRREKLARIAELENAGKLADALAEAERILKESKGAPRTEPGLSTIVGRVREKLFAEERERAVDAHVARIQAAIAIEDWNAATNFLLQASLEFPRAEALARFSLPALDDARRSAAVKRLENDVNASFVRSDLQTAAELLAAARQALLADPAWQALWRELDRRLRVGDRLAGAASWLEPLAARYPADESLAGLLVESRAAHPSPLEDPVLPEDPPQPVDSEQPADLGQWETQIRDSFTSGDLDAAAQQLTAARSAFSHEPSWQALWRELERRKSYETGLAMAQKAYAASDLSRAYAILKWLVKEAPDDRANAMLTTVVNERRKQQA